MPYTALIDKIELTLYFLSILLKGRLIPFLKSYLKWCIILYPVFHRLWLVAPYLIALWFLKICIDFFLVRNSKEKLEKKVS